MLVERYKDSDLHIGLDQASVLRSDDDARPRLVHHTASTRPRQSSGSRIDLRGLFGVTGARRVPNSVNVLSSDVWGSFALGSSNPASCERELLQCKLVLQWRLH